MRVIENIYVTSTQGTLNTNGNELFVQLQRPLELSSFKNVKARVLSAAAFYNFPNVITNVSDKIEFTYNAIVRNFTLEQGLYSSFAIQERIAELLVNNGMPSNLLVLQEDVATGKFSFQVNNGATPFSMNFDINNTLFKNILGFSGVYAGSSGTWVEGTNKATLNKVNSVLWNISFCDGGYYGERAGGQVAHEMHIETKVGYQIISKDVNPKVCRVNETQIDYFTIKLTNESGENIINTEPFTCNIEFFTYE